MKVEYHHKPVGVSQLMAVGEDSNKTTWGWIPVLGLAAIWIYLVLTKP